MFWPTHKCNRCEGSGRVQLNESLYLTLQLLAHGQWMSTSQVHAYMTQLSMAAVSMRMRRLMALGLVERRWIIQESGGRESEWRSMAI